MTINILVIFIVMKRTLNPELKEGDKIICYFMEGETSVPPGTTGTVTSIGIDPFERDSKIISVNWDNGVNLSLISSTDAWKMAPDQIKEGSGSKEYDYYKENPEIFESFDWKFLREYLKKVRDAGPVNMYQAAPFLYSGKEWIDRYYGENNEDNEDFQEVLDSADEAKNKMIQGTLEWMESKGMEVELSSVNRVIDKLSVKMLLLYMNFYS